ncbi:hypothetical protein [Aeromonas phage 4L372D]|uniref:Uncharacterized protein n=2 Tax=Plateaulakevirus TaxID=2843436 RepID=A0A5B9N9A6_9CAUD|nr:hypothetical protein HWC27_gp136 [Aeromonas phage 4L372D]YP_009846915.1 hypothetical protein HWC28_gp116 [Aeromonas phage 4L372XY]QEG08600.1 hypothetical protein [Aeromonas phage 4L372D]QEG08831.1 hypothetical protein [Aeromonas phage 4L372XY]
MKNDIYKALLAIVTEYAEGRGPLVKYKEQNDKIMELVNKDPSLFRVLGFGTFNYKPNKVSFEGSISESL